MNKVNSLSNKELNRLAFPKDFSKKFDAFVDSLNKKQFYKFMDIQKVRGYQLEVLERLNKLTKIKKELKETK